MKFQVSKEINQKLFSESIVSTGNRANFSSFYQTNNFWVLWQLAEPILNKQATALNQDYQRVQTKLESAKNDLDRMFGIEADLSKLEVYLRFSPDPNFQGGQKITEYKVAIEKGSLIDQPDFDQVWLLILHELIHSVYINDSFRQKLREYVTSKSSTPLTEQYGKRSLLEELLTSSFAAGGYLAEKYFDTDQIKNYQETYQKFTTQTQNTPPSLLELRSITRYAMYNTIQSYLDNQKTIDDDFLDQIWRLIK